MEAKPRCTALLFLIAFVGAAAGSPVCPRPSAEDYILGRPDTCWDLDPSVVVGGYQIGFGVVEAKKKTDCFRDMEYLGDEVSLHRALNIVQRNSGDYVVLLFHAAWCPFSKLFLPNFYTLSALFPTIRHFAFEESIIRPSILSRYGVRGFPSLIILNSTMRVQYHGSRTIKYLVAFYNHITDIDPLEPMPLDKFMGPPNDSELKEDMELENCPFSWARSPEKLFQQDGYLALASCFLLLRLLYLVLPYLSACVQRAWRRHMRFASLGHIWNFLLAYTEQAKWGIGRLCPCKQSNLQENALNARAWASQSLASVSLGEPSSGRASPSERK